MSAMTASEAEKVKGRSREDYGRVVGPDRFSRTKLRAASDDD